MHLHDLKTSKEVLRSFISYARTVGNLSQVTSGTLDALFALPFY